MVEETQLLCHRMEQVIGDAVAVVTSTSLAEKRKQLQQITGTIENLERMGVTVPQELMDLSEALTKEVSQYDVAMETMKTLRERLQLFRDMIEPHLRVTGAGRRTRRADMPDITPVEDFYPVIVEILQNRGGSDTARRMLESVFRKMEDRLLPGDLELHPNDRCENWRRTAKHARWKLVQRGVLRSDAPQQTWQLADNNGNVGGN